MKYALADQRVTTDGDRYWIAPTAVVIGQVRLGRDASIWWNAVLRGDNEPITLGPNCNIQDGSVLHTDPGYPIELARDVSVGHMVMLHGCRIGENTLIGIGSVILNGVTIGRDCLIGANSFLPERKTIPDNSLVMGSPGKVVREVSPEQAAHIRETARHYVENWQRYKEQLEAEEGG